MKNAPILALLTLALMTTAPLAVAQVSTTEILQAKAAYTVETLKSDALCGEASLLWQSAPLAEKGIIGKPHLPEGLRKIVDRPPQGHSQLGSYATKIDIEVNGMRVVGIDQAAGQLGSLKLNFDMPAKEVFANLPGKPVMEMTEEIPGTGIQIWTEKKPRPVDRSNQRRLRAHSYQNHTQVYCERSYDFNMRKMTVMEAQVEQERDYAQVRAADEQKVARENKERQRVASDRELKDRKQCELPHNQGSCNCVKYQAKPPGGRKTCDK